MNTDKIMNATIINGGKVHRLTKQAARCGVGKQARHCQWQMDLGEVTCRRCVRLGLVDQRGLPLKPWEHPTSNIEQPTTNEIPKGERGRE